MSLLTDNQIKAQFKHHKLIQLFVPRKVKSGEINGYGEVVMSYGLDPHGYTFRADLDVNQYDLVWSDYGNYYPLQAGTGMRLESLEKFNMPKNLGAIIQGKSSYTRNGLIFSTAVVDAGFSGYLQFFVYNASGREDIRIYDMQGIAQIMFFQLDDVPEQLYEGNY